MKESKGQDEVDRISDLPDPILHIILSRLPATEEAIRTSILSRRWRYMWTWVPSIDIDYARRVKEFDSSGFIEFVNWVLANKSFNLDSFRLRCPDCCNTSTIWPWIDAALMKKTKLVDFVCCLDYPIKLPHCVVTSGSLEVLRVRSTCSLTFLNCRLVFPALRVLELKDLGCDGFEFDVLEHLLPNLPVLEDLSLIDCFHFDLVIPSLSLKSLRIEARMYTYIQMYLDVCCPKLEFLQLVGKVARNFIFKSLYSLKKAVIHPHDLFELDKPFVILSLKVYLMWNLCPSAVTASDSAMIQVNIPLYLYQI